jgi:hypothetical protein
VAEWTEGRRERAVGVALLIAVFLGHAAILFQHPVVGAAENGDFWRVMKPAGIVPLEARAVVIHQYVSERFALSAANLGSGGSSAALIAVAAKGLSVGGDTLDIRQVGASYLLLYALAFAGALYAGVPAVLCALLAWAALDLSYSLYVNSFFADPAGLLGIVGVTLALCAGAEAPPRRAASRRALLLVAALLAGFAKNLYALTPLLAAAAVAAWPSRAWAAHLRREGLLLAALLLGGALSLWHFTAGRGYRFPDINRHHVVFRGLTEVDDRGTALAELGIDPAHAPLAGRSYFTLSAEDRQASAAALRAVSRADVALAYLRHPRRLERAAHLLAPPLRDTTTADPNFADRSQPPALYRGWWQFAQLRGRLWPVAAALVAAAVVRLVRAAYRRRWQGVHAALLFLLLNAAAIAVLSVLGDGFFGLARHLMAARLSIDLVLAIVAYGAFAATRRASIRTPDARRPRQSGGCVFVVGQGLGLVLFVFRFL